MFVLLAAFVGIVSAAATAPARNTIAVSSIPLTNSYTQYTARAGFGCPPVFYDLGVDIGLSPFSLFNYKTYITKQTKCGNVTGQDAPNRAGTTYHVTNTLSVAGFKVAHYPFDVEDVDPNGVNINPIATGYFSAIDVARYGCSPSTRLVAYTFAPIALAQKLKGKISFCSADPKQIVGNVAWVPLKDDYAFTPSAIRYGNTSLPIPNPAESGLDAFATFAGTADGDPSSLPVTTFEAYQRLTGATPSADGSTWTITIAQFKKLKNLTFIIGGVSIPFIPDAQVLPFNGKGNLTLTFKRSVVSDLGNFGPRALDRVTLIRDESGNRAGYSANAFTKQILNYKTT